jgi:hypothetical protein
MIPPGVAVQEVCVVPPRFCGDPWCFKCYGSKWGRLVDRAKHAGWFLEQRSEVFVMCGGVVLGLEIGCVHELAT